MNPSILLISNDSQAARSLTLALGSVTREGPIPQITSAVDGETGLEIAQSDTPDVVVAELVLPRPGISGLAMLHRLREIRPQVKTILVSDHGYVEDWVSPYVDLFLHRTTGAWGEGFTDELARSLVRLLDQGRAEQNTAAVTETLLAGKYRLVEELGRGGMGAVYRAEDTFIHRKVAIKLLDVPASVSPEILQRRMRREVMIAGRMAHPNLVTVYDAGFEEETLYLVMELVKGNTLAQHLQARGGALPREEAIGIIDSILSALTYAHALNVVHCDLKPENVLLAPGGGIKVTDFGIARLFSSVSDEEEETDPGTGSDLLKPMYTDLTLDGAVPGTLAYMAPEQMIGEPIDPRADLYSVGVLLFEMLHGVKISTFGSPLKRATVRLPEVEGDPHLTQVLEKSMALDRDDRWASAEEFAAALSATTEEPWWHRFLPWDSRRIAK